MGGRVIYIRQMTARQVAQWWTWVYEKAGTRRLYDEQLVELFRRLACDVDGKDLVAVDEAQKLRETPGAGGMLSEFWTEAKRRNLLYQTAAEEDAERDRFFTKHQAETALKTVSADSPADAVPPTGEASATN